MKKNVAIVHFNTPELTEATILSLRKHGGESYQVYIFDNSDKRPFTRKMKGVKVFNNTKGKYINFDKELEQYPERDMRLGGDQGYWFCSDKHMMSVQKLWDLVPDGFLLMDSDILIRQSVDFMFMENEAVCGEIIKSNGPYEYERLAPMLLWINVPMLKAAGARFFNPERAWALHKGLGDKRNCWDTGAQLLYDVRTKKPDLHGIRFDIRPLMVHFGAGSWHKNDPEAHFKWLDEHCHLWYTDPKLSKPKYTVLTYIFNDYEIVHEIGLKDPDAEYLMITDNPNLKSDTWEVIYDGHLRDLSAFDKCYEVRFHPFRYAKTDTVVRIDGSIGVKKSLRVLVDDFAEGGQDRCLMIHPTRSTMTDEYDAWVRMRGYPKENADKCIAFMQHMGYDIRTKGLYQMCFEIVKNTPINNLINDITFDFLRHLGDDGKIERIDQTIFSFVVNHMFQTLSIMPVGESLVTNGKLMQWYAHKSNRKIGG